MYILNNDGYESIRSSQTRHFGDVYGADHASGLFIPDFRELAQAFKLDYVRIETLDVLCKFAQSHNRQARPIVADLRIEKFEYRGPSVQTVMDAQGRPSTTPLMEISW